MKKITYLLFATVILLTGCNDDFQLGDNELTDLAVSLLPGYVAFSAPGVNVTIDDIETAEGNPDEFLNVEIPTGNLSDITVNYVFSGTAVWGVDFNVAGATSAGGTLIIEHKQTTDPADGVYDNGDIEVELLTDDVVDGVKTLIVTLVSASNAEGELAIGRGGTDLLTTSVVNIADIDCPLDPDNIVGDWELALVDKFGDGWNGASLTFEIDGVGTDYTIEDGATANFTITVPAGTTTLMLIFNSGNWDGEVEWTLIAPNGETASEWLGCDAQTCPPTPGEARLDTCVI